MPDVPKPDQELRFRNVTLHSQGRKEHGTLYLFRHHLLFSYVPPSVNAQQKSTGDSETRTAASTGHSGNTESHDLPTRASNIAAGDVPGRQHDGKLPRSRAKEIWVPFPMINQCILRPSHLQSANHAPRRDEDATGALQSDELFPPVFGTPSFGRPSTDSARLAPYASPQRPPSPSGLEVDASAFEGAGRQPSIRIRRKDLQMMALHFHSAGTGSTADESARQAFYAIRDRCCVERVQSLHAFYYKPPKHELDADVARYDARREFARMGISDKATDGPGAAWRITDINRDYDYSATYPSVLCVPRTVSDNMLKYGGSFRSRSRIPALAYLHSNGGSITRSSQPLVGVQNKRNPQDERLVSAIFSSHTPPLQSPAESPPQYPSIASPSPAVVGTDPSNTDVDQDVAKLAISQSDAALSDIVEAFQTTPPKRVYGSTRRNLIVDARPKINALANRATGGGIEDIANYSSPGGMPVEKVFLNIANIHVMRASLEKIFDSLANSDYIRMKPDQEALRKSGWLGHIANMLEGAETVGRVIGLGGSHVLIHCSDGWDRTAQISALAQVMLDPYYRTLDGFIALVQKDFLSFGHKFKDRNGIEGVEKWFQIENERIAPSRGGEAAGSDASGINAMGQKALSGAKNWIEKNRNSLFRQQNTSKESLSEQPSSRSSSPPPPNPLLHSSANPRDEKEHKVSEKEISPIFHQFLDAIYQLLYQFPAAFEFNERFLRRLFYHTYACQYGEFLFNTERERLRDGGNVPSVWAHFQVRRQEYINSEYVAKTDDPLLFPKRAGGDRGVQVRWWHDLFGRKDEEMNVPQAFAPSTTLTIAHTPSSSMSFDEKILDGDQLGADPDTKVSKSTPNLATSASLDTFDAKDDDAATMNDSGDLAMPVGVVADDNRTSEKSEEDTIQQDTSPIQGIYDGDPLGVMSSQQPSNSDRLDFAAFASQNAFRDR